MYLSAAHLLLAGSRPGRALMLWLLGAGSTVAGELPQGPELVVTERIEHHALDSQGWQELPESLARMRSGWDHGRMWSGATRTEFLLTTQFRQLPGAGGCVLAGYRLEVDIVRSLPTPDAGARALKAAQRQRWEAALAQLAQHEEGHRRHALEAANKLHAGLQRLRPLPECRRLQFAVERLRQRVSHAHNLRGRLYDQRSRHGLAGSAAREEDIRLAKVRADAARRRAQDSLRNVVR